VIFLSEKGGKGCRKHNVASFDLFLQGSDPLLRLDLKDNAFMDR